MWLVVAARRWRAGLALLVLLVGGGVHADVGPLIVNGSPTQHEAATGALLDRNGSALGVSCSGVLVGCRTFLTAAHCVCPGDTYCAANPADHAVYLQHGGIFEVESILVHPQYNFGIQNDIAVVRLAQAVSGIAPAPINSFGTPSPSTPGTIVGFGSTRATNDDAGLKRRGQVHVASCSEAPFPIPEPAHVCWKFDLPLGAEGENSNTCFGDSGGPLFISSQSTGLDGIVAGLASGGSNSLCNAPDVAFDTNVFETRLFIASASLGDLGTSSCDSTPPVGSVSTRVVAAGSAALTKATTLCRKDLMAQVARYAQAAAKAWQSCLDGVASGKRSGPCPDATLNAALLKARTAVDPVKIERRCPASVALASLFSGWCATADTPEGLRACVIAAGDHATNALVSAMYANPELAQPMTTALARCQKAVAASTGKFAQMRSKALASCRGKADRGRVTTCPDDRTASRIARAANLVERGVGKSCSAAQLASLDSTGGKIGVCDWTAGVAGLAACLRVRAAEAGDVLQGVVEPVQLGPHAWISVASGTQRLRATLNAVDPAFGTAHELNLYARFAGPASPSVYSFASTRVGVFEAIDLPNPMPGEWHFFVDEVSGRRVPYQLTITAFGP